MGSNLGSGETLEQGTEPPTAPRTPLRQLSTAPGVCVCVCVHCSRCVCALGWVKCREHISLLVILCIIVYVTNKKIFIFLNQHIIMISEGSCATEDWSNDAENSALLQNKFYF